MIAPSLEEGPQRTALRPLLAFIFVLVVAGAVRFVGVADIDRPYFDEKYYVTQAQERVASLEPVERPAHPPLGTWLIAGGIHALGDRPLGWRGVPAALGVAGVALTFVVAQLAWRRPWLSVGAAAFVALDGLAVVTSRIAILDGLQMPFALGAVAAVLAWRRSTRHQWWWWLLAGLAVGAAVAIKWNGAMLFAPVVGARVAWHRFGSARRLTADLVVVGIAAVAVYVGSYASWFIDYPDTKTYEDRCAQGACGTAAGDRVASWFWEQGDRIQFHRRLEATHPDRSHAITWPVMSEPVTVYLARCVEPAPPGTTCPYEPDETRQIIAVGNPVLWWLGFAAVIPVFLIGLHRRAAASAVVAGTLLALYLPWFASPKAGFLYFLTPAVPFVALVLARALAELRGRWRSAAVTVVALAFVAMAVFLAPIHFAWPIDEGQLDARSLLPGWDP